MRREVGQCWEPMVDLDDPAPRSASCLDDDRALALVDGQLSRQAREAIEAHLDVCATCRRFVSELAKESLFESPTERPTDLEQTGYAPGRPGLLDVALTVRDLAATRVGVPDAEAQTRPRGPRGAEARDGSSAEPTANGSRRDDAAAQERASPSRAKGPSSGEVDRWLLVVAVIALSLSLLTVLAALTSLAALGYAVFRS